MPAGRRGGLRHRLDRLGRDLPGGDRGAHPALVLPLHGQESVQSLASRHPGRANVYNQAAMEPYRAPWWLPGSHVQTIYPYLALRREPLPYRRERVETPDGDFVDLDWVDGTGPVVILFHGLEGSSRSHYATAILSRGRRGVVPHWRGCSGEPNRLPRAYHSGDHEETGWMMEAIRARTGDAPLFAVGVSLGGSALLNL